MSELSKHQEQFKRLGRWYERFKNINDGQIHDKPSDCYQDEVIAFFMNCHHLKVWIINDPTAVSVANKVEAYINNNTELSLCAYICNSLKHLRLLKKQRSKEKPEFGPRKYEIDLGTEPKTIAVKYTINTLSGPRDAFDIATKCMEAWGKFYSDNNLKRD